MDKMKNMAVKRDSMRKAVAEPSNGAADAVAGGADDLSSYL